MKFLGKLLLLGLLIAAVAIGYFWYCIEQPYGTFSGEGTFVTVPHGASRRTVARLLERNGIIRNALAFEIYARRHPKRTLQAGEYQFDRALPGKDVFWKLANGQVFQQPFTVREGETMFDIARDLEAGKLIPAEDFLKAAEDPTILHDIAPQAKTLEGFLFPATYQLPRHPVATEVASSMVQKFREEWSKVSPASGNDPTGLATGRPVLSVVTLASLVERETPKPEERPLVAGVFENRLKKGMMLQCDPTVIYALERLDQYKGSLTSNDLRFDSPYNTYAHTGLPPGPIGNPGTVALRAALQPADTTFLYFVANTQGGHFFSSTLEEHNKNVNRYHRLLSGLPADPPKTEIARKPAPSKKKKRSGR